MRRVAVLLLLGASCAPAATRPPSGGVDVDAQVVTAWKKEFYEFAEALRMVAGANPADRARGLEKAAAMAPYQYFSDDQRVIAQARAGDAAALAELARRGEVLDAVQAFLGPYNKARWEAARRRICSKGEDMAGYLAMVLVGSLLIDSNQAIHGAIRYELVEIGEEARRMVAGVLAEKVRRAPETPIGPWKEITQLGAALLGFGERSRKEFEAMATSAKVFVRVCAARAVGEARAAEQCGLLARMLHGDREWEVRAAAAKALGDARGGERSCRPLLEALSKERDPLVQQQIVIALGRANCAEAVPRLMTALDVPGPVGERAMEALYDLTGERIASRAGWLRWYRDQYPAWKAARPK